MPEAQVNLGHMYNEGLGVNVDYEQALYWYTLASESDQPEAIFNLGLLYLDGNGVTQHSPTAPRLLRESGGVRRSSCIIYARDPSAFRRARSHRKFRERTRTNSAGGSGGVPEAQFTFANVLLSGVGAPRKSRGILDFLFSEPVSVGDPSFPMCGVAFSRERPRGPQSRASRGCNRSDVRR